jgi:hypothetical protein
VSKSKQTRRILIVKLARVLDADADELLLLAEKIPDAIRNRVLGDRTYFGRWPPWMTNASTPWSHSLMA